MIIKSVRVRNFRCILDGVLNCEPLTALVGANGSGKSSFLRALELFYASNPRFGLEDFYNGGSDQDIEITVTFARLGEEATEKFAQYVEGEDLTVARVLSFRDGKATAKFYGSRLQNPEFLPVRQAGGAIPARQKYAELKQRPEYADLPQATSQGAVLDAIRQWEQAHPEKCTTQRDDGQFFGFTEVAQGYLGRFTRFIRVPAVRDAAEDAVEGKGRPVTEIMDLVVRATLANREELRELRNQAQVRYDEIMASGTEDELRELEGKLTATLKTYVPDAGVQLNWLTEGGVAISLPKADIKLLEDGYATGVGATGHGLQRAFILTMLQHLAAAQAQLPTKPPVGGEDNGPGTTGGEGLPGDPLAGIPSLLLGIEEPELYQHPNRQRHLANILLRLASGALPGVALETQVIYTTHSPLFVGIDRFEQVRVLRKVSAGPDVPKITRLIEVNSDSLAEALWEACDRKDRNGNPVPKFTWQTLKPRLQAIMTPWMGEGFFADTVVLVEGEDDRAAIMGTALSRGLDLESVGISVIPCGSKSCLDRPYLIFSSFEIPVYVIWDSDRDSKGANPRQNQILLRLTGQPVSDWPCGQHDRSACFENELEDTVRKEIGAELFDSLLVESQIDFEYTNKEDALKNPHVFRSILEKAGERGARCHTLESILDAVIDLRQGPRTSL